MGDLTKREKTNKKISEAMTKKKPLIVQKLEQAFAIDASIEEACYYAGISRATYYNWVKLDPKLFDKLERLRQKPILLARQTVVNGINGNPDFAMRYLEKKVPNEFGNKSKLELAGKVQTEDVSSQNVPTEKIKELTDRYNKDLKQVFIDSHNDEPQ